MRYVHRCRACGAVFASSVLTQHRCDEHRGLIVCAERYQAPAHHGAGVTRVSVAERLERAGMQIVYLTGEPDE